MRNSDQIFKDLKKTTPGLTAVCTAKKIKGGIQTNISCVTVFVAKKKKIKELKPSEIIPKKIDNKVTDVIESEFKALTGWVEGGDRTVKYRPAPGGVSVGHPDITAGTLGGWVKNNNDMCILSNNHVLANKNNAVVGDPIYQQGVYDGGGAEDEIAKLTAFHIIDFTDDDNVIDAAIAKVNDINDVDLQLADLTQKVTGSAGATVGMAVTKSGRTTAVTEGTISSVDWAGNINYGGGLVAHFINQIYISSGFIAGGDSGSWLLENIEGEPITLVGLLFAGNRAGNAIANPIASVFNILNLSLKVTPTPDFDATPKIGSAPLEVQFTDLSTNNPISWLWDFGDIETSEEQSPLHTYQNAGSYTVSLTATNADGSETETKTHYIAVSVSPVADFVGNPTSGYPPFQVQFTDLSVNYPTVWSWDFGDEGISSEQNPLHTYESAVGTPFTVSLTATNDYGNDIETKEHYIRVVIILDIPFYCSCEDSAICEIVCNFLEGKDLIDGIEGRLQKGGS